MNILCATNTAKLLFVFSEFDPRGPIKFVLKSRVSKLFHSIHVCEEPTGSQSAQPEEVSNVHALKLSVYVHSDQIRLDI